MCTSLLALTLDGELSGHGGLPGPVHHQAGVHSHIVLAHFLDLQDLHPILLRHRHSGTGLQGSISLWVVGESVAWSEKPAPLLALSSYLQPILVGWTLGMGSRALCSGFCQHA